MAFFSWVYQLLFGTNGETEPDADENSSEESEESSDTDEEVGTKSQANKDKLESQGEKKSRGFSHSNRDKKEILNTENNATQISPKNPQRLNKKKKPRMQKKSSGSKKVKSSTSKKNAEDEDKLAYLDRLSQVELMTLCQETDRKCKDFWGPVDDLKPLQEKVEKLMYILSNKFSQQESSSGAHIKLQEALNLLEMRVPMIESAAANDDRDESDEETQESKLYLQVAKVGMRALRLNKQIRCEAPKKRGHINVLIKQFIKCQTDLDALNLDNSGDVHALEASRDVQIFCNETLNSLNQFLEG